MNPRCTVTISWWCGIDPPPESATGAFALSSACSRAFVSGFSPPCVSPSSPLLSRLLSRSFRLFLSRFFLLSVSGSTTVSFTDPSFAPVSFVLHGILARVSPRFFCLESSPSYFVVFRRRICLSPFFSAFVPPFADSLSPPPTLPLFLGTSFLSKMNKLSVAFVDSRPVSF